MTTDEIRKLIAIGDIRLFYKRKGWKKKRKEILKRDNKECQHCKRKGGYAKAICVHHIKHLDKRPDLALVDSNLVSLCDACHNVEHQEKFKGIEVVRKEAITLERW